MTEGRPSRVGAGRALWLGAALIITAFAARGQLPPAGPPSTLDPPTASVAVRIRVPAEVAVGTDITYRITAENISRGAAAHHVLVKVPLPPGVKVVRASPPADGEGPTLMWKIGTLESCQKRDITLVVRPAGDDINLCARVQFEHGQCVRTRVSRPGLQVRRVGPTQALLYDAVSYKLEVSNTGKVTARNVVLEESLPKGLDFANSKPSTKGDNPLSWSLGDLAPGRTKTVEYDAFVKETGKLAIRTVARAAGGLRREIDSTLDIGQPGLEVNVAGPARRVVGRPARYTITVTNPGSSPVTRVDLTDDLPREIVYLGSTGGGRLDGDQVRWGLGTIPAGGRKVVTVDVRSTQAGSFENVVTAKADRGLVEQGKAKTTFTAEAPLVVEIDRDRPSLRVGEEATFTVRVANTSARAAEKTVALVVTLPEGLELIEARGPGKTEAAVGKVSFTPIVSLEALREVTATVRVRATKPGEQTVQAEAASDRTGPDAAKSEESVTVRGRP